LDHAIRRHGFKLTNPNGNFISVVRVEPAKAGGFLGIGSRPEREVFLAQVGFPGWKTQVNRAALKTVREATKLTTENGCDTQVLFEGAEPLDSLISEYAEPLKRLATK
jgi:death-on-curing protein